MVTLNTTTKVLIIGTGLSGVALAQILRKANINFEIFERDDGTRKQGWGVGLDECLETFQPLLPDDLVALEHSSTNYILGKPDNFTLMDGPTHAVLGTTQGKSGNKGLDVQYSKRFLCFKEDREGVTVFFEDGTSARGDILVGADGSNSAVRTQLLHGFKPDPSPYMMFMGTVVLSETQYAPLIEHSTNGPLVGSPGLKAYVLLVEYLGDGTALFNWNVAWKTDNIETEHDKWRVKGAEEQLEKIQQLLEDWPPEVVKAILSSKHSDVHLPPFRLLETVLPPQGLPRGRITLVGDAAHSMIPFRGMGANTAIIDSCELGQAIINGVKEKVDLEWMLKCYEEVMVPRGRAKVLASRATGESTATSDLLGGRALAAI